MTTRRILIATSNPGKLRDFAGAARAYGIEIACLPNFSSLPAVVEDSLTFEANACKKAEQAMEEALAKKIIANFDGKQGAAGH